MKNQLRAIVFSCAILLSQLATGQSDLSVVGIDFPSEANLGGYISFSIQIQNTNSSQVSGDLNVYLHNGEINESHVFELPESQNVIQYFGGGQTRTYYYNIPVNNSNFRIGGNTVVIWPSFELPGIPVNGIEVNIFVNKDDGIGFENLNRMGVIYPNPASNFISVKGLKTNDLHIVRVFNLAGVELFSKQLVSLETELINVEQLKDGLYVLVVENNRSAERTINYFTVHK